MDTECVTQALAHYSTPFYLFDESELLNTIEKLKRELPGHTKLCYAMKANPFIVKQVADHVSRIEVCSPGEIAICQLARVPLNKIVVSGVHKDEKLMYSLASEKEPVCRFTIESVAQYRMFQRFVEETGRPLSVLFRLTSCNQFGLDLSDLRILWEDSLENPLIDCRGIQFFSGTQKMSARRIAREVAKLDALREELACKHPRELEDLEIEYGPGLTVSYFEGDECAASGQDDEQLRVLASALGDMRSRGAVVIELGRAIAAACGTYVTSVVDVKHIAGNNYAIVDGGMHQLVYYGNSLGMRQPACAILPKRTSADKMPWTICGSLCTTSDVLAKQIVLPDVRIGDVLAFGKAGAYSMTEGISLFLSRDLPRVLYVARDGQIRLLRDRIETYVFNAADGWRYANQDAVRL